MNEWMNESQTIKKTDENPSRVNIVDVFYFFLSLVARFHFCFLAPNQF